MPSLAEMNPSQDALWRKRFEIRFSALYWQYVAASRDQILKWTTLISTVIGGTGFVSFFVGVPLMDKVLVLLASVLSIYLTVFDLRTWQLRAAFLADAYVRISGEYEKVWTDVEAGALTEEEILDCIERLGYLETMVPTEISKFNDKLRAKAFKMLVESQGLKDDSERSQTR